MACTRSFYNSHTKCYGIVCAEANRFENMLCEFAVIREFGVRFSAHVFFFLLLLFPFSVSMSLYLSVLFAYSAVIGVQRWRWSKLLNCSQEKWQEIFVPIKKIWQKASRAHWKSCCQLPLCYRHAWCAHQLPFVPFYLSTVKNTHKKRDKKLATIS